MSPLNGYGHVESGASVPVSAAPIDLIQWTGHAADPVTLASPADVGRLFKSQDFIVGVRDNLMREERAPPGGQRLTPCRRLKTAPSALFEALYHAPHSRRKPRRLSLRRREFRVRLDPPIARV